MHHYTATIMNMRLTDIAGDCLNACGKLTGAAKKRVADIIKADLLDILQHVVEDSLSEFNKGRHSSGKMAQSLRNGIQVKGQTPSSIRAVLSGVDYTLLHEEDVTLEPSGSSKYLAIPLDAACRADGRPIFSSPRAWQSKKNTFVISGDYAAKTRTRRSAASQINPHSTSQVAYIVYKDNRYKGKNSGLVYLYKLVPYSLFHEGKTNVYRTPLKKLGLSRRFYLYVQSAWEGWSKAVAEELFAQYDMTKLRVYKGIKVEQTTEAYQSTYERIHGKTTAKTKALEKLSGFANDVIKITRS